ncbi:hypothetical protein AB0D33_38230 [Streptomyces sp. NPDC048404]|uniref:hypothetical protein n=1 Tax=unclassified Streptomyces TaxID=2593676 RepID=UPI003413DCAF
MSWVQILDEWPLIEADLHETYGVDVCTPGLLEARSWRWLRVRIFGLLSADSRINRHLFPDETQAPSKTR